ncbi:hypothetical protein DL93DRAFT_2233812 [Clavulina sp. PMI_390]|nr:hypothetical protein DL93DRAFT_2233812 [Clavulina sp. PMI_390]
MSRLDSEDDSIHRMCPQCHCRLADARGNPWSLNKIEDHINISCPRVKANLRAIRSQVLQSQGHSIENGGRLSRKRKAPRDSSDSSDSDHAPATGLRKIPNIIQSHTAHQVSAPIEEESQRHSAQESSVSPHQLLVSPNRAITLSPPQIDDTLSAQHDNRLAEGQMSEFLPTGRGQRIKRRPVTHQDYVPSKELQLLGFTAKDPVDTTPTTIPSQPPHAQPQPQHFQTEPDLFGMYREYIGSPTHEADDRLGLSDVIEGAYAPVQGHDTSMQQKVIQHESLEAILYPFPNLSTLLLLRWFHNGNVTKSIGEQDVLIQDVLQHPHFNASDVSAQSLANVESMLDALTLDSSLPPRMITNNWKTSNLTISVPFTTAKAAPFTIHNFCHQSIIAVVKSFFERPYSPASAPHYVPFHQIWNSPTPNIPRHKEEVFGDLYSSESMLKAHKELQSQPPELIDGKECGLPRAIAALMFWSDAMQLANFGTAKLWPLYLCLGNQAKWGGNERAARNCFHIAYFPSLPESIHAFVKARSANGKGANPALLAHCRRELFHAAWDILLDEGFIQAYVHGVVITCGDRVKRRLFPRIFTYSADYPEKALIVLIRELGLCPCPTCTIRKSDIKNMGYKQNAHDHKKLARIDSDSHRALILQARNLVYTKKTHSSKSLAVNSKKVNDLLKSQSLTPTENSFSKKLGAHGFNVFSVLVPDILHEFLLGVWKDLITFIIRLVFSLDPGALVEFNSRSVDNFRILPTYGAGKKVRRFGFDTAALKSMTGERYQMLLLCIMPVLDGLAPGYDSILADITFISALWLSLAKLHQHSESTVNWLERVTPEFYRLRRRLAAKTKDLILRETPAEAAKRAKKASIHAARRGEKLPETSHAGQFDPKVVTSDIKYATYKYHSLAKYPDAIRTFGTCDSFTTGNGEREHKVSKHLVERSNHRDVEKHISNNVTRSAQIQGAYETAMALIDLPDTPERSAPDDMSDLELSDSEYEEMLEMIEQRAGGKEDETDSDSNSVDFETRDETAASKPKVIMATNSNLPISVAALLAGHEMDPAFLDFRNRLLDHLLSRLHGSSLAGDREEFSNSERSEIRISGDRLYRHASLRINYTTYNVHRDHDTINCTRLDDEHSNVMVYANDDIPNPSHPFWYAKVLGIYHAFVIHRHAPRGERIEFLWVRWYGHDIGHSDGWKAKRLEQIGFIPESEDAFGFLNPSAVIRSCHLIPAFSHGRTQALLRPSLYRHKEGDWQYYYVNRFVDRDMFMRYTDLAVGHMQDADDNSEHGSLSEEQESSVSSEEVEEEPSEEDDPEL